MPKAREFSFKNVGRIFRIMTGEGVPGGSNGRYQFRITDLSEGVSKSYSASLDELRRLNAWIVQELYFRATTIDRREHDQIDGSD